jgi:hypothetical protein
MEEAALGAREQRPGSPLRGMFAQVSTARSWCATYAGLASSADLAIKAETRQHAQTFAELPVVDSDGVDYRPLQVVHGPYPVGHPRIAGFPGQTVVTHCRCPFLLLCFSNFSATYRS